MSTQSAHPVVPERIHLDWRHGKGQFAQHQLIGNAGGIDKVTRQDCQQVRASHHFARREN